MSSSNILFDQKNFLTMLE